MKAECMRCKKRVEVKLLEQYEMVDSIVQIVKCKECELIFSIGKDKPRERPL